jgi:hypothetical protein
MPQDILYSAGGIDLKSERSNCLRQFVGRYARGGYVQELNIKFLRMKELCNLANSIQKVRTADISWSRSES